MKKMIIAAVAAVLAVSFTGCKSVFTSDGATGIPQVGTAHPGYEATFSHKDVRVKGEAQVNVLFGLFAWGVDGFAENSDLSTFSFIPSAENYAKSAAVYNTCQKNQVDTLLGTRYTMTVTNYFVFKTIKCEVAGFPAVMNGIKKKSPYVIISGKDSKVVWMADKPTVIK